MEKKSKALRQFGHVSIVEGSSFLVLLFVAMPLKYSLHMPEMVRYVGWIHGMLFIAYIIIAMRTALICKWALSRCILALMSSVLPFGPFIFEKNINRKERKGMDSRSEQSLQ